ncbi:MAG: type II toxin-antitoxin system HicA family toxin [Acidobacteriota bacterium]
MAKLDKLLERLLHRSRDFTWDELVRLLRRLGFEQAKSGKTSGSRQRFVHPVSGLTISLHRPHPRKELRRYQIDQVVEFLEREGFIA